MDPTPTSTESETEEEKPDPNLDSVKKFILEMPLYHEVPLKNWKIRKKVHEIISDNKTIDAYCIYCEKESVFEVEERHSGFYGDFGSATGFLRSMVRCTRDVTHRYIVYLHKNVDRIVKMGQIPSAADLQIPQAVKYRKILGNDQYKEFTTGIGLSAHGVGIGAFVYLRRIFENLIEEAHVEAEKDAVFPEVEYVKMRMDEKIQALRGHLPVFLVENRALYSILSKGIHQLTEDECLKYFETVRIGIEQILDEKIIDEEKKEKAKKAREAIQRVSQEVSPKAPAEASKG